MAFVPLVLLPGTKDADKSLRNEASLHLTTCLLRLFFCCSATLLNLPVIYLGMTERKMRCVFAFTSAK